MNYSAVVFKLKGRSQATSAEYYNIIVGNQTVFEVSPPAGSEMVYARFITTDKEVPLKVICNYMTWKFKHCQKTIDGNRAVNNVGLYTNVVSNLAWIRSVLDTEIDYHVLGKVLDDNLLKHYKSTESAGMIDVTDKYSIKNKQHPLNRQSRPNAF